MTSQTWTLVAAKLLMTGKTSNPEIKSGLNPVECLRIAVTGSKVSFLNRNIFNKLGPSQLKMLRELGVPVEPGHYEGGLVSIVLRNTNRTPDLKALLNYFQEITLQIVSDPLHPNAQAMHNLLKEYSTLRDRLAAAISKDSKEEPAVQRILRDLKDVLTRIGCLVLPQEFLSDIRNPQRFMNDIAPHLGLYIVSLT